MATPKYKEAPSETNNLQQDEQEVRDVSNNINDLLKDPKKLQKAIKIIEEMISESNK